MKTFVRKRGKEEDIFKVGIDRKGEYPAVVIYHKLWDQKMLVSYAQPHDKTLKGAYALAESLGRIKEQEGYIPSNYLLPFPFDYPSIQMRLPIADKKKLTKRRWVIAALRPDTPSPGFITVDRHGRIRMFNNNSTHVEEMKEGKNELALHRDLKELDLPIQSVFIVDFAQQKQLVVLQCPYMIMGKTTVKEESADFWLKKLFTLFEDRLYGHPTVLLPLTVVAQWRDIKQFLQKKEVDAHIYLA